MVKIISPQNIPAELLDAYMEALQGETIWKETDYVRKRYPFRLPHMQGNGLVIPDPDIGSGVTWNQFLVRRCFARAVQCWKAQPHEGGVTPPTWGPRNRSWWYDAAAESGLWYYDYYIQQSMIELLANKIPDWCKKPITETAYVQKDFPDTPTGFAEWIPAGDFAALGETWIFLKPGSDGAYVWFYVYGWGGADPWGVPVVIEVYEVSDAWDIETLTWNNKPATGAFIKWFYFPYQINWFSFSLPNHPAVILKLSSPSGSLLVWTTAYVAEPWKHPCRYAYPMQY